MRHAGHGEKATYTLYNIWMSHSSLVDPQALKWLSLSPPLESLGTRLIVCIRIAGMSAVEEGEEDEKIKGPRGDYKI